jgi:hypothetical protein
MLVSAEADEPAEPMTEEDIDREKVTRYTPPPARQD